MVQTSTLSKSGHGLPSAAVLWRVPAGRRYAVALIIDSLGDGMLRPFLLLYAVIVEDMSLPAAGLALSIGFAAGLAVLPLAGRWVDRGGMRSAVVSAMLVRGWGLSTVLLFPGEWGFGVGALLLGAGGQVFPPAHAAVLSALATDRNRDAVLAAARALRNAGMGLGALLATLAVARPGGMQVAAWTTTVLYVLSALTVLTVRVNALPAVRNAVTAPLAAKPADGGGLMTLNVMNLPFALCYDVLEVALPALLVTQMHVATGWASTVFIGNTVLVVVTQLRLVRHMSKYPRRSVFASSGVVLGLSYVGFMMAGTFEGTLGAILICSVAIFYTTGEMMYAGSGTALVAAAAPPGQLGRHLARWQLSTGLGRAAAPVTLTTLLAVSPACLWLALATLTTGSAWVVWRRGPDANTSGSGLVC